MGLVNWVVPPDKLDEETLKICKEIMRLSLIAIAVLKSSFYGEAESTIGGIARMFGHALRLYCRAEEARDGDKAFLGKRPPDYLKWK